MRRLGSGKNVNGNRILILYTETDNECVYPAELLDKSDSTIMAQKKALLEKVLASDKGTYIERNVPYMYQGAKPASSDQSFTNYWMSIENDQGDVVGLIGMQFANKLYLDLIPTPVVEEPYSLSLINLYDSDFQTIWHWGCDECPQNYATAIGLINEIIVDDQGNQFVQWQEPKLIKLDLELETGLSTEQVENDKRYT